MVIEKYSWTVLDDNTAIKHTDLSFFKNHGSGIPIEFRFFFEISDMSPGDNRYITLSFNGKQYKGRLNRSRSTTEVTRIFWGEDLSHEFNRFFPDVTTTKEYPDVQIIKTNSIHYSIAFVDYFSEGEFQLDDNLIDPFDGKTTITKEGRKILYYTTRYERNPKNREIAIKINGTKCMACGFDFEKTYGVRGRNFIEVHHIKPLFSNDAEVEINPETDLICVCSNCHRMIHRSKNEVLSLERLKDILEKCRMASTNND